MALHGLGLGLFLRDGPRGALELARQSLTRAMERSDAILIVTACDLLGQITKLEGPPLEAIAILEQGIEAASSLDDVTLRSAFVLDPIVNMRAALAIPLLLAGFDHRSREQSRLAHERAVALKQPIARMIATWLSLLCDLRRGDRDPVAAKALQLRGITDEGALAQGEGPSEWFRGLADAWSGRTDGAARVQQAFERYAVVGMAYGSAEVLGYSAEALLLLGELDRAGQQIEQAIQLASRLGDHSYLVQLLLLKRALALQVRDDAGAAAAGNQALDEARRQQSPWLELTALVALCDGPSPGGEHVLWLRTLLARLPERSDAPLMHRAASLLGVST